MAVAAPTVIMTGKIVGKAMINGRRNMAPHRPTATMASA